MHDALLVRGLERLRDLRAERAGARLGQRTVREQVGERLARDVLHHEEFDVTVLIEIEQRRDAGMEQARESPRLDAESLARLFVSERVLADQLERDLAIEPRVGGAPHHAHPALAEPPDDLVPAERAADHDAP